MTPATEKGASATYRVGTLAYTRAALLTVMFWMLLGDLCLQIVEAVPNIVPLQLRWAGASDTMIGFVAASVPFFVMLLLNPFVGMQSDRHRGRLGRRRPFLLWFTPAVVASLVLLGCVSHFAAPLARVIGWDVNRTSIVLVAIFNLMFSVANTYVLQVYQFLFVDVIPQQVMGKFIGVYRAIGALGTFVFHRWLYGHAASHTFAIYSGAALLYAVAFLLLIWRVEEGQYPEPTEAERAKTFPKLFRDYFRDCFGHWFYVKVYLLTFCFWAAIVPFNTFLVFFATGGGPGKNAPSLGLPLDQYGQIRGWITLCQVPVFFLVGPFLDRFHPVRVVIAAFAVIAVTYFASAIWVNSATELLVWGLVNIIGVSMFTACQLTIFPRLLPKENYGQFFTANQIFGVSGLIVAPVLCGRMLDVFNSYRLVYLWAGVCSLAGLIASILLYRHWCRLGGDAGYVPPTKKAPPAASALEGTVPETAGH